MPDPVYRKATPADAEAIAGVGQKLWDELGAASGLIGRATTEAIRGRMDELGDRGAFFLCESEPGQTCGFSVLQPDVSHPNEATVGVWLVPDARGKGHGRELAVMATDFAREAGYGRLRGIIPEGNEPALSFFGDFASIAQIVGQGMEYELPL